MGIFFEPSGKTRINHLSIVSASQFFLNKISPPKKVSFTNQNPDAPKKNITISFTKNIPHKKTPPKNHTPKKPSSSTSPKKNSGHQNFRVPHNKKILSHKKNTLTKPPKRFTKHPPKLLQSVTCTGSVHHILGHTPSPTANLGSSKKLR